MTEAPWRVPLSDIRVDEELLAAARDVLASGWWSMGPRVEELEEAFATFARVPHALAVSNGTAALHLALMATGCGPGDEVILPSLNFVAAANTVTRVGATPVFCDVVGETDLNLDVADLARAMGSRTKAIIVLHYGGFACDLQSVMALADEAGVAVIEDAAHAPGGTWKGRPLGTIGAAGCFSFFSNKNLPVGEGGMVVTSDDELAGRVRSLRSHGMTTLTWQRHRGHASTYDVLDAGFNYRIDEVRAALAIVQLGRLEQGNAARRVHAAHYRSLLDGVESITMPFGGGEAQRASSHHLVVAVLARGVDRDAVRARMHEARIQTSVHYPPIHRFTLYRQERPLPVTDDAAERIVTLPLFPHMTDEDVELVVSRLLDCLRTTL